MDSLPRIVIVGGGFGGLQAAKALKSAKARITLIDRQNYHLFQPFLYQVATSSLAETEIATPIRHILRKQKNTEVILGEVTGVDPKSRTVNVGRHSFSFDYLILATGSKQSYFGNPTWERYAPGLKSLSDALYIRNKMLVAFERAEIENDPIKRKTLMTFVMIGGGPTGIEMAGSLAGLSRQALKREFRNINPRLAKIILLEADKRILPSFSEKLSALAQTELERLGVEVRTNAKVKGVDGEGIYLESGVITAGTIVWTAGVEASPAFQWLGVDHDRKGRIKVLSDLSIPGYPEIYAIGDTAWVTDSSSGKPLPELAPVAMQQGRYVAHSILKILNENSPEVPPFKYVNKGNLATIGKTKAVAQFKNLEFDGILGWFVWAVVHIYYLISFRNRLFVIIKWAFLFLTYQRPERLIITGDKTLQREEERQTKAA